jgi:hypothetical protein
MHKEKLTRHGWAELAVLSRVQQRQRLLEKMVNSEVDQERFWEKVKVESTDKCWPWMGLLFNDGDGYGQFTMCCGGRDKIIKHRFRAHRIAYLLAYGHLPDDLCVCHTCDNPPCMNPYHLFLGTPIQNAQDRTNKQRDAKGEQHGMHKLTTEEVLEIRHIRATQKKKISYRALGEEYGVSTTQIGWIVRRESWKHLP